MLDFNKIKIEAILNLLISKGVITKEEFEEENLRLRKKAWEQRLEVDTDVSK